MNDRIVFTPEAEQLAALYRYIADVTSPGIAMRYTSVIVRYCESLDTFPHRGNIRDDIRPGLRVTHYKGRVVIAFDVENIDAEHEYVLIIGIFYGGQDYATILKGNPYPID